MSPIDALEQIEDQIRARARAWVSVNINAAEVEDGPAYLVVCGDDPDTEPGGEFFFIGHSRVYADDVAAASIVGQIMAECFAEGAE